MGSFVVAVLAGLVAEALATVLRALWRRRNARPVTTLPHFIDLRRVLVLAGAVVAFALLFVHATGEKVGLGAVAVSFVVAAEYIGYRTDRKRWRETVTGDGMAIQHVVPSPAPIEAGPELPPRELTEDEERFLFAPSDRSNGPITEGLGSLPDPVLAKVLGQARRAAHALRQLLEQADQRLPPLPILRNSKALAIWEADQESATLGRYMNHIHSHVLVAVDALRPYVSNDELDRLYRNPRNTGDLRMIAKLLERTADMAMPESDPPPGEILPVPLLPLSDEAERKKAQRTKLGEYIHLADVRLHIIAEVATGKRPERPELRPPEPSGNETIDRHHELLHQLRVKRANTEAPYWKASAIAWAAEVRKWLRENLEQSYAYRFDHPVREKPRMGAPFQEPPDMRELWEELAVRQERLVEFLKELRD